MPPRCVLLVEDDALQRVSLARQLHGLGVGRVLQAADGAQALQALRDAAGAVDLVVSDLDMPGMDGMALLRHLAQEAPGVPAMLVSAAEGVVLESVRTMAAAYGVALAGVLAKPVRPGHLAQLVAHLGEAPAPRSAADATAAPPTAQEVRQAMARDEFEPFLQPKVDLDDLSLSGFEALARWRHADGSVTAPSDFLAVMESEGLVDELSWSMLEKACGFCAELAATGIDASVSVNFPADSLSAPDVADRVSATCAARGLQPRQVVLELTESSAAEGQLGPVLENLTRLRLRGFRLSIDDYGTGYSSLQQLGRMPFTELKIDQSFVRNAGHGGAGEAMLRSTLELARSLRLVSVAEGVETEADWTLLRELGCDLVQGFYVAQPLAPPRALEWAQQWSEGAGA